MRRSFRSRAAHRREAERLVGMVWARNADGKMQWDKQSRAEIIGMALVHGVLALSADPIFQEEP